MNIQKANINDVDELAQLFDAYRVFYRKESDVVQAKIFLSKRINNNESVIYISLNEAKTITGFVQLYPLFSSTRMERIWLLNDLFVKPEFRGLGISKALINEAKKLVIDTKSAALILETEKSNAIGNKLYPSVDFELEKDHNYYFWDNKFRFSSVK